MRPGSQADLAPAAAGARITANLAALDVLRRVQQENRPATADEQQILARWSRFGAIPQVFDEHRPEHAPVRAQLAALTSPDEYAALRRTTLNAHYTDAGYVQAIWDTLAELGFGGGQVLQPGCGSGNFIGLAPAAAQVTGVELDPVTAAVRAHRGCGSRQRRRRRPGTRRGQRSRAAARSGGHPRGQGSLTGAIAGGSGRGRCRTAAGPRPGSGPSVDRSRR